MKLENGKKYEFQTDISYSRGLNGVGFENFIATVIEQDEEAVVLAKETVGKFITINKSSIKIAKLIETVREVYAVVCETAFRLHLIEKEIEFYKSTDMKIDGYPNYKVEFMTYEEQLNLLHSGRITYGWENGVRVWYQKGRYYESGWGRISDHISE